MRLWPWLGLVLLGQCLAVGAEAGALYLDPSRAWDQRVTDLLGRLSLEEKAALLNHGGAGVPRLGIRADGWNQCLHGVWWNRPTTLFPVPIAMAATWDPPLVRRVATAISDEARAIYNGWHQDPGFPGEPKGLIYRAPVINLSRNPYWGRINECYGEDPFLTGRMGVAFVEGLQGDDPHYLKLVATLKHFAVNNVERDRTRLSALVPERSLHEYWLAQFRTCIREGGAQSIMASYNAINGVPNNRNPLLLTAILKGAWGFQGFVVSDLGGVNTMVQGHERGRMSFPQAVAESVLAGCDFSDREFATYLPAAVRQGLLPEAKLDEALARVLRARFRLGEFDPPSRVPYSRISTNVIGGAAHRELARETAREAMVLLKNDRGLLPLDRTACRTIAVIGPLAATFVAGGYSGRVLDPITPLEGLRRHAARGTRVLYASGADCPTAGHSPNPSPAEAQRREAALAEAAAVAKQAAVVLLFVGTTLDVEAEGRDRTALGLPGNQEALIERVWAANPRTVLILLNAGPLTIPWAKGHLPAILEAWWAGEAGGDAIAEVLFGEVNPAGRLPYTVYAAESQVPPQDQYDVAKGFTYMYIKGEPLFPFGHGLSYTRFRYRNLRITPRQVPGEATVTVAIDVANVGRRAGAEVVQLYTHARHPGLVAPAKRLAGFARVQLQPAQTTTVRLEVSPRELAFYDEGSHEFVVAPGGYDLLVGSSSADIRARGRLTVTARASLPP